MYGVLYAYTPEVRRAPHLIRGEHLLTVCSGIPSTASRDGRCYCEQLQQDNRHPRPRHQNRDHVRDRRGGHRRLGERVRDLHPSWLARADLRPRRSIFVSASLFVVAAVFMMFLPIEVSALPPPDSAPSARTDERVQQTAGKAAL